MNNILQEFLDMFWPRYLEIKSLLKNINFSQLFCIRIIFWVLSHVILKTVCDICWSDYSRAEWGFELHAVTLYIGWDEIVFLIVTCVS